MKLLAILCFFCITTFCYAASVTSLLDGTIKYLPEEGQTVKKGDVLVELSDSGLKIKKEELKDLKTDIERARKLHKKSAVSLAALENTLYNFEKCKLEMDELKLEYKDIERKHKKCKLKAPFDCKIIKVLIIPNSGVELGQEVLEVEKVTSSK